MPAATEVITLWPDGPPTVIEDVPEEASFVAPDGVAQGSTIVRNVSEPTLSVYPAQGEANGVGILVVPGGGWAVNMWTHEGVDIAEWLTGLGYTCFVLKYRVMATPADPDEYAAVSASAGAVHAAPWPYANKPKYIGDLIGSVEVMAKSYQAAREACADDGRRALEIIRENADRFGVRRDAIGSIGFSAGAYLITDIVMDPQAEQVAFFAPIYGGETNGNPVPADAPPLFMAVTQDDVLFKACEGLVNDWIAADRPTESHTFRHGGHGFGVVTQNIPVDNWKAMFEAWLRDLGH